VFVVVVHCLMAGQTLKPQSYDCIRIVHVPRSVLVKNAFMYLHLWDLNRKAPGDSTRTTGLTRQQLRQFNDFMNVLGVVAVKWHQGCIGTWSPGMKDEPHMGISVTQNPQWKNLLQHESVQHRRLFDAYDQTTDKFSPAIEQELHQALRAKSSGWDLSEELRKMGDWGVHATRQLQVCCCCLLLFVVVCCCLLLFVVVVCTIVDVLHCH
jgi:hypothetical protein